MMMSLEKEFTAALQSTLFRVVNNCHYKNGAFCDTIKANTPPLKSLGIILQSDLVTDYEKNAFFQRARVAFHQLDTIDFNPDVVEVVTFFRQTIGLLEFIDQDSSDCANGLPSSKASGGIHGVHNSNGLQWLEADDFTKVRAAVRRFTFTRMLQTTKRESSIDDRNHQNACMHQEVVSSIKDNCPAVECQGQRIPEIAVRTRKPDSDIYERHENQNIRFVGGYINTLLNIDLLTSAVQMVQMDQTPSDQTPSDQTPSDQTPSDQTPSSQTPSKNTQIPCTYQPVQVGQCANTNHNMALLVSAVQEAKLKTEKDESGAPDIHTSLM